MHPEAENLLKVLSLEHDIALPKIMVSSRGIINSAMFYLSNTGHRIITLVLL